MKLFKITRICIFCSMLFMLLSCEKEVTVANSPKIIVEVLNPLGDRVPEVELILYKREDGAGKEYYEVTRGNSNNKGIATFEELGIGEFMIMACEEISSNYVTVITEKNKEYRSKLLIIK